MTFTSIIANNQPALRLDLKAASAAYVTSVKQNSEWGSELFDLGFHFYIVTNGISYWVLTPTRDGFTNQIKGPLPFTTLPPADNMMAKRNAVQGAADKADLQSQIKNLGKSSSDSAPTGGQNQGQSNQSRSSEYYSFYPYSKIRMGLTEQEVVSILRGRAFGTNMIGPSDGPPKPGTEPLACVDHPEIAGYKECISQLYGNPWAGSLKLLFYRNKLFLLRSDAQPSQEAELSERLSKSFGKAPQQGCGSNTARRNGVFWRVGSTVICLEEGSSSLQVEELDWRLATPGTPPQ